MLYFKFVLIHSLRSAPLILALIHCPVTAHTCNPKKDFRLTARTDDAGIDRMGPAPARRLAGQAACGSTIMMIRRECAARLQHSELDRALVPRL